MEVVTIGVEGRVIGLRMHPGPLEQRVERDAISPPLGMEPRDIRHAGRLGQGVQVEFFDDTGFPSDTDFPRCELAASSPVAPGTIPLHRRG